MIITNDKNDSVVVYVYENFNESLNKEFVDKIHDYYSNKRVTVVYTLTKSESQENDDVVERIIKPKMIDRLRRNNIPYHKLQVARRTTSS